ncbi:MAG: cell division protein FtsA, partial [Lachnospiraceae bacterium]|nr:cell division protein FtsA [Lachnospiraceae bacterium]
MGGLKSQGNLVFGLDIGTRSIVGTVGFEAEDGFHVLAQEIREHESRAMLDGQIHDIGRVGQTILAVKNALEERLERSLTEVCIAAAGRVLKTVTVNVSLEFDSEQEVRDEDIYNLSMSGIEQAYSEFQSKNDTDMKFYCVGYTPMRYYLNGYQIGNLNGHKAKKIAADLIATFLPDDVVDGLYKATGVAGLHVANLTLEPIAAIQVAIPEKFRLLNLALVDVGAGTSDISITKDGSITAYGMIPVAGDSLTDVLVQKCLVDFDMAE